jgi:hypothetical protein
MIKEFKTVCFQLLKPGGRKDTSAIFDPLRQFDPDAKAPADVARSLNSAFLILLAGRKHPAYDQAHSYITHAAESTDWKDVARFYLAGLESIQEEIQDVCNHDRDFANRLKYLAQWLQNTENRGNGEEQREKIWSVFFPEAVGLFDESRKAVEKLRIKRTVKILQPHSKPINDPAREILFTANVLLTLPSRSQPVDQLPYDRDLKNKLRSILNEPQLFWYDHPIQIGVKPQHNELLYGLINLGSTLEFEQTRKTASPDAKLTCILSVSVTHEGLHEIARSYIEEVLSRANLKAKMKLFVFTETDTQKIIERILTPAAKNYLEQKNTDELLTVFGVDGEYGRHYSFLKAIAAFWQVFIKSEVNATFKIDLDQVFPQSKLVEQTGESAFQHFMTPLWGAAAKTAEGQSIELGMIAGALVNESDIHQSLFTPDVRLPARNLSPDELIFYSVLPQAISTEAEMMTRYTTEQLNGVNTCIERVHVTGGTNGIRIDSLRRHRPFTPSFFGRAEDQAYLLSAFTHPTNRLAYVHKDGLIMRHDKEAFAQEAIRSAEMGRLVGDDIRILNYSAYANLLSENVTAIKESFDPFTGSFISKIPLTVIYLRFSLRAAGLFDHNRDNKALDIIARGSQRIATAIKFISGKNSLFKQQYEKEKNGWNLYYDILNAVEGAGSKDDPFAAALRQKAEAIIQQCAIQLA